MPLAGNARNTTLCIRNTTVTTHHIEVSNVENYDWEGNNRPDHNFNDISIEAGQTICRLEDFNDNTTPYFTFIVDGTPTRITVRGKSLGWGDIRKYWAAYSMQSPGNPTNLWGEKVNWSNAWNLYWGYSCDIGECSLLEIR